MQSEFRALAYTTGRKESRRLSVGLLSDSLNVQTLGEAFHNSGPSTFLQTTVERVRQAYSTTHLPPGHTPTILSHL